MADSLLHFAWSCRLRLAGCTLHRAQNDHPEPPNRSSLFLDI